MEYSLTKHLKQLEVRASAYDSTMEIMVLTYNGSIHSYHYPGSDILKFCRTIGVSTQYCAVTLVPANRL